MTDQLHRNIPHFSFQSEGEINESQETQFLEILPS